MCQKLGEPSWVEEALLAGSFTVYGPVFLYETQINPCKNLTILGVPSFLKLPRQQCETFPNALGNR